MQARLHDKWEINNEYKEKVERSGNIKRRK
jgi:hypothetical protein